MEKGAIELPKLGQSQREFQDVGRMLQVLVADSGGDFLSLGGFVAADTRDLKTMGHDAAMKKFQVPSIQPNAVDTTSLRNFNLAMGFGLLLMPDMVIELSGKPGGGLTRLALPFLSLDGLGSEDLPGHVPSTTENKPSSLVEPMLEGMGVLVWNLARVIVPEKPSPASMRPSERLGPTWRRAP